VPESYGKRQRSKVKAEKAAAKEGRREARQQRQRDRATGNVPEESWLSAPADGHDQTFQTPTEAVHDSRADVHDGDPADDREDAAATGAESGPD
jgi:hypothetical protein